MVARVLLDASGLTVSRPLDSVLTALVPNLWFRSDGTAAPVIFRDSEPLPGFGTGVTLNFGTTFSRIPLSLVAFSDENPKSTSQTAMRYMTLDGLSNQDIEYAYIEVTGGNNGVGWVDITRSNSGVTVKLRKTGSSSASVPRLAEFVTVIAVPLV